MNDRNVPASSTAANWDSYWKDAESGSAFCSAGSGHPAVVSFWDTLFGDIRSAYDEPRIIDLASGSGALLERMVGAFDDGLPDISCLDVSPRAIEKLVRQFPGVKPIVADLHDLPLESGSYDVVTSLFGVEYAGRETVISSARLVAPGGRLAYVLHAVESTIYRQCVANLDAARRVLDARFLPLAAAMFEHGFAAIRGADRAAYEIAAKSFAPAIGVLEEVMTEHGMHVADDTIRRLYDDVASIHEHMPRYKPDEVLSWLESMQAELDAYAGRMDSMRNAAVDATFVDTFRARLIDDGFSIERADTIGGSEIGPVLAWAIVANRAGR